MVVLAGSLIAAPAHAQDADILVTGAVMYTAKQCAAAGRGDDPAQVPVSSAPEPLISREHCTTLNLVERTCIETVLLTRRAQNRAIYLSQGGKAARRFTVKRLLRCLTDGAHKHALPVGFWGGEEYVDEYVEMFMGVPRDMVR